MESSHLSSAFGGGIGERGREHEDVHGANETIATFSVCPKVAIGLLGGFAKNAGEYLSIQWETLCPTQSMSIE